MEIQNLLSHIKKQDKPTKKYLVLHIAGEYVVSACWEILNQKANIISISSPIVTDLSDPENVLNSVDQSYTEACSTVDQEPNDVILSLPEDWVDGNELVTDQKELINHVTEKLELKPLGFVVAIEAIVHHLYTIKGQPVTALFIQKTVDELSISWVDQGEIVATHVVGTSDDIASDLQEAVARFNTDKNPPALLYLYNIGSDIADIQQTLISIDWSGKIPFLHIPKIETLTFTNVLEAIVESSALQLTNQTSTEVPVVAEDRQTNPEDFGFQVTTSANSLERDLEDVESNVVPVDEEIELTTSINEQDIHQKPKLSLLTILKSKLKPKDKKKSLRRRRVPLLLIIGIVIMILAASGVAAAYWYVPSAKVTVYLEPLRVDRSISFTIKKGIDGVNTSEKVIPGSVQTTDVAYSGEVPATGTKTIGEKAAGIVTIYNRTNSAKTFEAGTQLTGPDSMRYTLVESVSVASASSKENPDLSVTTEPASAKVNIAATEIGGKYNVGSGTEFSVANFDKSSYLARAEGEISGGTSKEVTVVTQEDVRKLRSMANSELNQKVNQQYNQSNQDFISAIVLPGQEDSITENFSSKVGDEAIELSLSATMDVEVMTYRKSDVLTLLEEEIRSTLPPNQQLLPEGTEIETEILSTDTDQVKVSAKVKAKLSPLHDTAEIINTIKGKLPKLTEEYFKNLQGFKRVEIDIKPKLPPQIRTFPRIADRIEVEIKPSAGE